MIKTITPLALSLAVAIAFVPEAKATPYNIAPQAVATCSSALSPAAGAAAIADGVIRIDGLGEWASTSTMTFWGQIDYPWVQLDWDHEVSIGRVVIFDRPSLRHHTAGGMLRFSDGSRVAVNAIPDNGEPIAVDFTPRRVKWMRFEVTDGDGEQLGLSEIEVYPGPDDYADYVSWVDPYIETTRGRYFFFITGQQPYGMIGAAPLTRNKNQYGGGYNYNSTEVLGFPQLHGWMLSGLELMPTDGSSDPLRGEQGWKSPFSHSGEVVQPAYHRLFLERYGIWVEQTATDRVSFYRLTMTEGMDATILLNLGGYVATSTMVNAHASQTAPDEISGYFDTRGRLWGGPDVTRIYFVAKADRRLSRFDVWSPDEGYVRNASELVGPNKSTRRQAEGLTYEDAPSAGVAAVFADMKPGQQVRMKMAVSYVSIDNARENMASECPHWEFDTVRKQSQQQWNDMLGRIAVGGGTIEQRTKFYTDLWHVLLGRHKIDDINGQYPDYSQGDSICYSFTHGARFNMRQLPKNPDGSVRHHMYNSDAYWLTQWNLNTLWGLAYPDILDDFAASLVQQSVYGGLLPRGPFLGGYSFIMSGCPATSLIVSAYQRGICHKWNPKVAYREIKRNHQRGGMLAYGMDEQLDYYIANGYCPDAAGLTVQWAFEDWAAGQMALKMGRKADYTQFNRRSRGWTALYHPELKLLMPRRADGSWLHTNPLDGWGWEEANAWQGTFGLSHDLPRLAELMGGSDSLCARLDYAFRKAQPDDFVGFYGNGYVSYANQPGLSNAHVFAHVGKPWLTQKWVRRVGQQAYGATTPDRGYGGHDEDQGQMGCMSALMAIGLFSIDGCANAEPIYEITSPVFDEVAIALHPDYYSGDTLRIVAHNNSCANCYIQSARFNGRNLASYRLGAAAIADGGTLELVLGSQPNMLWGVDGGADIAEGDWQIGLDRTTRKLTYRHRGSVVVADATVAARNSRGDTLRSTDYPHVALHSEPVSDAFGTGIRYVYRYYGLAGCSDLLHELRFYPSLPYLLTAASLSAPAGEVESSTCICPIISQSATVLPLGDGELRIYDMPFANDNWATFSSHSWSAGASVTSCEATALYNVDSRRAVVVGSVDHSVWKSAVKVATMSPTLLGGLRVEAGYISDRTWDAFSNPSDLRASSQSHGAVSGTVVASPLFMLGVFDDWRVGLETYGEANAALCPRMEWRRDSSLFGWQSWGGMEFGLNTRSALSVLDFFEKELKPNDFCNGEGRCLIVLDSGWGALGDDGLRQFVARCRQLGYAPGIYTTPFSYWGSEEAILRNDPWEGGRLGEMVLRAGGKPRKITGWSLDPTHPAVKDWNRRTFQKFRELGFEYVKIDFMNNGSQEADSWYDPSVTTGMMAYNQGMDYLREFAGDMMLDFSIAPVFPAKAHSRRIGCDAWGELSHSMYTLNCIGGSWWLDRVYAFNDPDHMCLSKVRFTGKGSPDENEARIRYTCGLITGTVLLGGTYAYSGDVRRIGGKEQPIVGYDEERDRARRFASNHELTALGRLGRSFRPVEGRFDHTATLYSANDVTADAQFYLDTTEALYFVAFNYDSSTSLTYPFPYARLGVDQSDFASVQELWTGQLLSASGLTVDIPPKDVRIYRLARRLP